MTSRAIDTDGGVVIYGLNDVKKALKSVAPDLRKEMDNEIKDHLRPVQDRARSLVPDIPLSRWNDIPQVPGSKASRSPYGKRWEYERLQWNPSAVRRGISIRQGGRRRRGQAVSAAWRIMNRDAAGAVYELAGRGKSNESMTRSLQRSRPASRLIWEAWDERGGGIDRKIARTVDKYENLLQRRINEADDRSL